MKKKIAMLMCITMIMGNSLIGCGNKDMGEPDVSTVLPPVVEKIDNSTVSPAPQEVKPEKTGKSAEEIYADIIYSIGRLVAVPSYDANPNIGEDGVWEVANAQGRANAASCVGIRIEDITGDGIEELIVGCVKGSEADYLDYGTPVYSVFTIIDNMPYLCLEGWSRKNYFYLGDGKFFLEASGGAESTGFGTFAVSSGSVELECEGFYYTYCKNYDTYELGIAYDETGEWDVDNAELLDMSVDEFVSKMEKGEADIQYLELTPMTEYIRPAIEVTIDKDLGGGDCNLAILGKATASDVKMLDLFVNDVDYDGSYIFEVNTKDSIGELSAGQSATARVSFSGDLPNVGISYVDDHGNERRFFLEISGDNGALLVNEF